MADFKSPILWALLLSALIAFFYIVIKSFSKSFPKYGLKKIFSKESRAIFNALVESHFRNSKKYLENLKILAAEYPDEPMFFLFAGDIARKFNPEKAVEIHRDVLFRPATTGKLRALVLKHIGEDYLTLGHYKKAISVLKDSIKTAESPEAHLLLAESYEKEKDFTKALDETDRYFSIIGEKNVFPSQIAAKAVIYYHQNNSIEDYKSWLEIYIKRTSDENEKNLAEMKLMLLKGKTGKITAYIQNACSAGEKFELAARAMILSENKALELNSSAEGFYKPAFNLILDSESKENPAVLEQLDKKSFLFLRLVAQHSAGSKLKDTVISNINNNTLFICSECGRPVEASFPFCTCCLSITGRKLNITSGD